MDWTLYGEADKRGLLTGEKKQLYDEAKKRGLIPGVDAAAAVSPAMRAPDAPSAAPVPPAAPQPPTAQAAPAEDVGVVEDLAKSSGIGLAQGALGLATLPGNIEQLGRLGIDKAAKGLGYDPRLSERTFLPTFADVKGGIEKYTGPFYKPKTVAGEYARTVGEFAPLAFLGPGGAAARAVNVAAPAIVSETAGQITKGTSAEPWARAGGALAGGFLPNAAMRLVSPAARRAPDVVRQGHVANLEQNGVTAITAGQRLGSKKIAGLEDAADNVPFSGQGAANAAELANEQFTTAALRHAGVQNAPRATGPVINQAFTDLGARFGDLAARNSLRVDRPFLDNIRRTVDDYNDITAPSMRVPLIQSLADDLQQAGAVNGQLSGQAYQALRSRIESFRRQSIASNPQFAHTLGEVRDHLDDAMSRTASAADQAAWAESRLQYRNLLAIEKAMAGAGENTANGLISPSQLRTAVKAQNKRTYVRGQNPLGELAKSGEAILKPLKSSGTAERSQALKNFDAIGKIGTLGAGGSLAGGAMGLSLTGAGLAAVALPGVAARGLMSPWMQRYLANERAIPAANAYAQTRLPAFARSPLAVNQLAKEPTPLSGGIGPDYDEYGNRKQGAFK